MLSVFATGLGSVEVSLRALKPASPHVAATRRGTCTQVGSVLVTLPRAVTSKADAATLHSALTAAQVAAIRSEVRATSRVVVRLGAGSLARCGALKLTSRSPRVGSTTLRLGAGRQPARGAPGHPLADHARLPVRGRHDGSRQCHPAQLFRGARPGRVQLLASVRVLEHDRAGSRHRFTFENPDWTYRLPDMRVLGYTLNGHCVIHFLDESFNLPAYVRAMSFEQLKAAVSAHVAAVAEHYRGTLRYWTIS